MLQMGKIYIRIDEKCQQEDIRTFRLLDAEERMKYNYKYDAKDKDYKYYNVKLQNKCFYLLSLLPMKKLLLTFMVASTLVLCWCSLFSKKGITTNTGDVAQIANPASVFCQQNSGTLEIVTDANGAQSWLCHLPDGTTCEERAYMRGECPVSVKTNTWLENQGYFTFTSNNFFLSFPNKYNNTSKFQLTFPDTEQRRNLRIGQDTSIEW